MTPTENALCKENGRLRRALEQILAAIPPEVPCGPGEVVYDRGCIPAIRRIARVALEES